MEVIVKVVVIVVVNGIQIQINKIIRKNRRPKRTMKNRSSLKKLSRHKNKAQKYNYFNNTIFIDILNLNFFTLVFSLYIIKFILC